jgi:DNA-binding PadR family transcriptional regulator
MSLKHGLIGLLSYGPKTGYELKKVFEDSLSFFWQAKSSQIYRELDAMEQRGWLSSERVIQNDKPNKRVYSVTDSGKREFQNWLSAPESDIDSALRVSSAFFMRVFFAGETTALQSIELLRAYREKCAERGARMDAANGAISEYGSAMGNDAKAQYWKLTALYGEAFYRAGVEWADAAIAILEEQQ